MEAKTDIHKAAGVLIKDRKFLVVKSGRFPLLITAGGKIEEGESAEAALVRELREELDVGVLPDHLDYLITIDVPPGPEFDRHLRLQLFHVRSWQGDPIASAEIQEICWLDSKNVDDRASSVIRSRIIPHLLALNLID